MIAVAAVALILGTEAVIGIVVAIVIGAALVSWFLNGCTDLAARLAAKRKAGFSTQRRPGFRCVNSGYALALAVRLGAA